MIYKCLLLLALFVAGGCATIEGTPVSDQVPRMSIDNLKDRIGSSDTIVLDIRNDWTWNASNMKITGAIRENPKEFSRWYDKYPKEKTLVLYCT